MTLLKNRKYLFYFVLLFSFVFIHSGITETVHVGLYKNPPYISARNSVYPGITVEILNKLADQKNIELIYHYSTYEAGLDLLAIGLIDILPSFNNKNADNSLYPYLIHLKEENIPPIPEYSSEKIFIPCILIKNKKTADFFSDSSLYSKMIPLSRSFNAGPDFYRTIIDKYTDYSYPSPVNIFNLFFVTILIVLFLSIPGIIHLPAVKSINKTGREIISDVESPDYFSIINKKVSYLIKSDFFCVGDFKENTLYLNVFSKENRNAKEILKEKIAYNNSFFIYAVKNRKTVYIKNCDRDYSKYVLNNFSIKNIDSKINSVFIIPLLFNSELQGAAAVLDKRKNAFSFIKRRLLVSLSKYITISLKNRKLIEKNKELLNCIERDKNKILKAKQEVEYLAQHDPLTNLPNRLYLNEFLNQSIKKSNRTGKKVAVIFIDMDNFKDVNDTYGHQTGDKVLIATAKRFKNLLRESDIVIRFGGDEFIIILEDVNSAEDVKQVSGKIIKTCTAPVLTESADLSLSFSIGISMYPDNGSSADELIRKADIALYDVKNKIKGKWNFYSEPK